MRAGVHTGECELRGADLAGIAVHVGAPRGGTRRCGHRAGHPDGARPGRRVRDRVRGPGRASTEGHRRQHHGLRRCGLKILKVSTGILSVSHDATRSTERSREDRMYVGLSQGARGAARRAARLLRQAPHARGRRRPAQGRGRRPGVEGRRGSRWPPTAGPVSAGRRSGAARASRRSSSSCSSTSRCAPARRCRCSRSTRSRRRSCATAPRSRSSSTCRRS